jgi:hypothetical protein
MDRIRSLVAMARRRLFLEAWLRASWIAAAIALAIVPVLVLERRLIGLSGGIAWWAAGLSWFASAILAAIAVAAAIGWLRVRARVRSDEQVAIELDGRIGSGERLATAIALERSGAASVDPFAAAAIADAIAYAARPEVARRAAGAFPVGAPPRWWAVPAALAAACAAWFLVPQLDRSAAPRTSIAEAGAPRAKSEEERRLEEVIRQVEANESLAAKLDAELAAARKAVEEGADGPRRSPEDAAREASKRLAEMQQRLSEVAEGKDAAASKELRDALAKLELPPDSSPARDFAESLKQGDFKAAKEALAKLQEAVKADSGLSKEEREKLAKDLEAAAKQLDALAKDPSKLAEALKNAGMDPSLANNPAALQQAIQSSQQLNESQKQALRQMAQASQDAQQKLSQMSKQCDSMSGQCRNPQQGQQQGQQANAGGKGGQQPSQDGQKPGQSQESAGASGESQMSKMLDEAETERQMQMAAENAGSSCQGGGMSDSEADSALRASADEESKGSGGGKGEKDGSGGGHGQAEGGDRKMRATAFGTKFQKQKGQRQDGDVIAQQLVAGTSPTGESRVALEQVASEIAPGYERGTDEDPVPAHLREVHKRYFGDLRKKLEAKGIKPAAAPATAGGSK